LIKAVGLEGIIYSLQVTMPRAVFLVFFVGKLFGSI